MFIALTGTPGTGKSTVADELQKRGHPIVRVVDTIGPYITQKDESRDARIVDVDQWASDFPIHEGIVEGHLSHFLSAEQIIVLRCRPDILKNRLTIRGYHEEKVRENVEAEMLDVLLIEALDEHTPEQIYEIDVTDMTVSEVADMVEAIITGDIAPSHGTVDWLSLCADVL